MKMLYIFLQFGASTNESLSSTQLYTFWGVILLLVLLFVYFFIRTNKMVAAKNQSSSNEIHEQKQIHNSDTEEETAAAIALAIHMYKSELHDQESFTITLKKVSKIYSPWSSKIYTLRQNPR
jgi:Na+-transporting methylmalonyl-CoA/oxaloacetate decarboxylase gamma subunit